MLNSSSLLAAVSALLLAVLPTAGFAQAQPAEVTPAATTPASAPQASPGATATPDPMDNVHHVRQLVRDVMTNSDNIKSKGDFGAQLWLVQGEQFFQDWIKPATPNIIPAAIAPRGENIYTVIIFYGLAHDSAGLANVTYDITVHRPDGSVYSESKNLIGWQGLAPQESRTLELGRDHIAINFGLNDPAGLYTVDALVRDNVSRVELPLKQSIVVQ